MRHQQRPANTQSVASSASSRFIFRQVATTACALSPGSLRLRVTGITSSAAIMLMPNGTITRTKENRPNSRRADCARRSAKPGNARRMSPPVRRWKGHSARRWPARPQPGATVTRGFQGQRHGACRSRRSADLDCQRRDIFRGAAHLCASIVKKSQADWSRHSARTAVWARGPAGSSHSRPACLHPAGRAAIGAGDEIEAAAAGHQPAGVEAVLVAHREFIFQRHRQSRPRSHRAGEVDLVADIVFVARPK